VVEVYPVQPEDMDNTKKKALNSKIHRLKLEEEEKVIPKERKFKLLLNFLQYAQYTNTVLCDTQNLVIVDANALVACKEMKVNDIVTYIPFAPASKLFDCLSVTQQSHPQYRRLRFLKGDELMLSLCTFLPSSGFAGFTMQGGDTSSPNCRFHVEQGKPCLICTRQIKKAIISLYLMMVYILTFINLIPLKLRLKLSP